MIKRILVALDPDDDTPVATRYAARLAQAAHADVTGMAVVDTAAMAAEVDPVGAIREGYGAGLARGHLAGEARDTARTLLRAFGADLADAHVRHRTCVAEGEPAGALLESLRYHDLLVVGRAAQCLDTHPERPTDALARLVKKAVAPVLVVGASFRPVRQVLAAYDGSDAAARTLQRFAQLQPFGPAVFVELVHVRPSDREADRRRSEELLRAARGYLRAHDFDQVVETSCAGSAPGAVLLELAEHLGADLLVAGAHSVSAMPRLAFGSMTHALLTEGSAPLFLYH